MDIYKVKLTQEAEDDLIDIYDYICETLQAPQAAQRQYHRLAEEILSLDFFPERYAVIEAEPWHSMGLRQMPVDRYSVFYLISKECVFVTDILYSASNLMERLKRHSE